VSGQLWCGRDGALSETESHRLDVHLATCASCRAFLLAARALTAEVREAPLEHVPAMGPFRTPRSVRRRRLAPRTVRPAAKLSAVAAGVVAAALIGRLSIDPPQAPVGPPAIVVEALSVEEPGRDVQGLRDYVNRRISYGGEPRPAGRPGPRTE